jgi:hypothetical protein
LEGGSACDVNLRDVEGLTFYGDGGSVRGAPFESVDVYEEGCFSAEVAEGGAEEGYGVASSVWVELRILKYILLSILG